MVVANFALIDSHRPVMCDCETLGVVSQSVSQFWFWAEPLVRKPLIPKTRRDVRVVEGARSGIALTVCDGVLQISITVAKQPLNGDRVYSIDRRKPR